LLPGSFFSSIIRERQLGRRKVILYCLFLLGGAIQEEKFRSRPELAGNGGNLDPARKKAEEL
jgi:hypothetical protein